MVPTPKNHNLLIIVYQLPLVLSLATSAIYEIKDIPYNINRI